MRDREQMPVGGVTVTEASDETVAWLWGEIDDAVRHQVGTALSRALHRELPVVLDASQVEFIDSTGVAFLIQICLIARDEGLTVRLRDPAPVVRDVIDLLGIGPLFEVRGRASRSGPGTGRSSTMEAGAGPRVTAR